MAAAGSEGHTGGRRLREGHTWRCTIFVVDFFVMMITTIVLYYIICVDWFKWIFDY